MIAEKTRLLNMHGKFSKGLVTLKAYHDLFYFAIRRQRKSIIYFKNKIQLPFKIFEISLS